MTTTLPLHTILAELDDMGCSVLVKSGAPSVSQPKNAAHRKRFEYLLGSLRARREEVLAHFAAIESGEAPHHCRECSAWVYVESSDVFRMCRQLMCPLWRKESGVGPEWMAQERNQERYRREGKK